MPPAAISPKSRYRPIGLEAELADVPDVPEVPEAMHGKAYARPGARASEQLVRCGDAQAGPGAFRGGMRLPVRVELAFTLACVSVLAPVATGCQRTLPEPAPGVVASVASAQAS